MSTPDGSPPLAGSAVQVVTEQLVAWADRVVPGSRVEGVRRMPGNSGISFGFGLVDGTTAREFVIRLAPPGASSRGSSDVLRQADLLDALGRAGVPVPAVRWRSASPDDFGSACYVADLVPGRSTHLFDAAASHEDGTDLAPVFAAAMQTLATVHAPDLDPQLVPLETTADPADEVRRWEPTLRKTSRKSWLHDGLQLRDRLLAAAPPPSAAVLVHGDFYSNNWLFQGSAITAILDWEIAGPGAPELDVAWAAMMYDDATWGPSRHRWVTWSPSTDFLVERYSAASPRPLRHLAWWHALARYRFACITARAVELHQTGRRVDPAWDIIGEAFPTLVSTAHEHLATLRRR